jgi:hypothetical protein
MNGETVTRRLTVGEAQLYWGCIGNNRRIRALVARMRTVEPKAAELISTEGASG